MANLLIIDDDSNILQLMTKVCTQQGHTVHPFLTGKDGLAGIEEHQPDLAIVDLKLGDYNGIDIVEQCSENHPNTAVIMVTGFGSVETAVEAMRLGAFDYLTKPFELADLQRTVELALQQRERKIAEATVGTESNVAIFEAPVPPSQMIGESDKIEEIRSIVEKIANNDHPVLLEGEFGVGKQVLARNIHNHSSRRDAPFKVLQCSALPEDLLELELFSSATSRGETIFGRAGGGTVLLEEIDMLPVRLQSMLESYLEEMAGRRMAGSLPSHMDTRFMASSNEPLEKAIEAGKFREDLYYKISVIPLTVPPLRSRKEDIPVLADFFLERYATMTGGDKQEIDKYASQLLEQYGWPGNVGELQNAIERACSFSENGRVRPIDLPPKVTQKVEISDDEEEQIKHQLPIGSKLSEYIKKQEKIFIRETLKYNEGSREKTASMLGVSIATLYRKMGLKLERDKILAS
jgi:DNA-binding NtrC family response regulator